MTNLRFESTIPEERKASFELLPLGVALIDAVTGRVCRVNSQFVEIFGNCGQLDLQRLQSSDLLDQNHDALAQLTTGKLDAVEIDKSYVQCDGSLFRIRGRITLCAGPAWPNPCLLWIVGDTSLNGQ